MIQLPAITIEQSVLSKLQEYQNEIDSEVTFEKKSEKAKKSFSAKNKIGNATFDKIKIKLTEMCSGARRCVYCEDSVGDEVEHIKPKDIYPDFCFNWNNYVYACGNCNGPKNNKFAVFRKDNGEFYEVNQPRGTSSSQPPVGSDVMINPRAENALNYCMLDLESTFKFVITAQPNTIEYKRADYTFNEVLRLNDQREFLRKARETAYSNYKSRLGYYNVLKNSQPDSPKLERMIIALKSEAHPTVWKEMQRQYEMGLLKRFDMDLDDLFSQCPEALSW